MMNDPIQKCIEDTNRQFTKERNKKWPKIHIIILNFTHNQRNKDQNSEISLLIIRSAKTKKLDETQCG